MPEIKAEVIVDKLEAKVKMVDVKEDGGVVDRQLITEVKFQYEGTPYQLEKVLYALKAGHRIDATFSTPQLSLPFTEPEKEPVLAG